jgi:hypothetical protein
VSSEAVADGAHGVRLTCDRHGTWLWREGADYMTRVLERRSYPRSARVRPPGPIHIQRGDYVITPHRHTGPHDTVTVYHVQIWDEPRSIGGPFEDIDVAIGHALVWARGRGVHAWLLTGQDEEGRSTFDGPLERRLAVRSTRDRQAPTQ